jgi:hypothetical protein
MITNDCRFVVVVINKICCCCYKSTHSVGKRALLVVALLTKMALALLRRRSSSNSSSNRVNKLALSGAKWALVILAIDQNVLQLAITTIARSAKLADIRWLLRRWCSNNRLGMTEPAIITKLAVVAKLAINSRRWFRDRSSGGLSIHLVLKRVYLHRHGCLINGTGSVSSASGGSRSGGRSGGNGRSGGKRLEPPVQAHPRFIVLPEFLSARGGRLGRRHIGRSVLEPKTTE